MKKRFLVKSLALLILCALFISCLGLLGDDDESGPEFLGIPEGPLFDHSPAIPDPFGTGSFMFRRVEPWVAPIFAMFELGRYEKSPPFFLPHLA